MDIQTDAPASDTYSRESTLVPDSPKGKGRAIPLDEPPAYEADERARAVECKVLADWHPGASFPLSGVRGGVAPETLAEWAALKDELGLDCRVIDDVLHSSSTRPHGAPPQQRRGALNKFVNVYNTYVYGSGEGRPGGGLASTMIYMAGTAVLSLAIGHHMGATQAVVPGSATYYDRLAWSSFNGIQAAGEGILAPDGTQLVWQILGRLGGGAARNLRGWPT
jgi:hypothetical protein